MNSQKNLKEISVQKSVKEILNSQLNNQSHEISNEMDQQSSFQANQYQREVNQKREIDSSIPFILQSPKSFTIINQTPAISAEDGGFTPAEIQARHGQKLRNSQQKDQQSLQKKEQQQLKKDSSQKLMNGLNLEIQSSAIRLNRKLVPVNKTKQRTSEKAKIEADQSHPHSPTDQQHTQDLTQPVRTDSNTFDHDDNMGFKINTKSYIKDELKDNFNIKNLISGSKAQNSKNILISSNKEQASLERIVNSLPFAYSDEQTKLNKSYVDRVLALGPIWNNTPNQFANQYQKDGKDYSAGKSSVLTTLHGRNQSQDDARNVELWGKQNLSYPGIGLNRAARPSVDQSQMSGGTLADTSPLIEEVRRNNFSKVSKLMEQFILGKNTSGTVTGRQSQQRQRNIKNSFQTLQAQRKRSGFDKTTQNTENPDYPGAVGPKMQINLPRQLVLYQLSKNIDAAALESSLSQSVIAKSLSRPGQTQTTQEKSFLEFLESSAIGPDIRNLKSNQQIKQDDASQQEILQNLIQGIHSQSSVTKQRKGAPFAAKSFRTIDNNPNSFLSLMKDRSTNLPPDSNPFLNGFGDQSQNSARNIQNKSYIDIQPSLTQNSRLGAGLAGPHSITQESLAPALTSFHITDLLERSIILGAKEREENKLRQIIEFYKRSVKTEKEMNSRKEIFIKNYRLHVVKDAEKDVTDEERVLLTLNKGTTIHVGNSIIKPEISKFSTEITDKIHEVYPFLLDQYNKSESKFKNIQNAMKRGTHKSTYSQDFITEHGQDRQMSLSKYDKDLNLNASTNLKEARQQQREILRTLMEDQWNYKLQGEFNMEQLKSDELENMNIQDRNSSQMSMPGQQNYAASQKQLEQALSEIASSRPFTAAEQADQEAVFAANRIFDRWLRNIFTQSSEKMEQPQRRLLTNGKEAAPGILDINWQIAVENNIVLKQRPLGLDELTVQSVHNPSPYKYLQLLVVNRDIKEWYSRFVLKTQAVHSFSKIAHEDLQSMTFADYKVAIDFQRHHLSHLDQLVFKDDNLPLELFLDIDVWIKDLAKACYEMRNINELRDEDEKLGIPAETIYFLSDGTKKPIDCQVMSYDPLKARFLVANKEMQIATWRSRLFILLESDSRPELENLRASILNEKLRSLEYLRIHKLIQNELTKRFDYLKLSNELLVNIQERLGINVLLYNVDSVRKIIIQVEALYVFSILKSTIASQKNDPFIKGLLIKYGVPFDSPALSYFKTRHKEKDDLPGIEHFDIRATKIELDQNSLLLGDEKYIKMPIFLNQVTSRTIGAHKLFRFPFDTNLLFAQNVKEFRKIKKPDLHDNVNTFPLQHNKFVLAQKAMSKYFHQIAKYRWAETIQKEVWSFVQDDFEFDIGRELQEDQIDPVLLRLFYQIKLYMQTVMFEYFEEALHDYLWFLLSFALRDEELKECKAIEELKYNQHLRLRFQHKVQKLTYKKGELVNDVELIPLKVKPMIQINLQIEDVDIVGKLFKKQKVFTKPDLETVTNELFSVILNMHDAFKEVDRVDKLVFPLLILPDRYLVVPDVNNNEKLKEYVRVTEKLIEQSLKQTRRELQNINSYMNIFDKRLDNLIISLKKRSFELQQDISDGEGKNKKGEKVEGEEEVAEGEEAAKPATASAEEKQIEGKANDEKVEGEEEESEEAENEEEDSDKDNQVNDMAYKSVEIDDRLFRDELFNLRALIWKILENIHNQYDYGIVYLDCVAFKDRIVGHIRFLIEHLESYVRLDFTNKQKSIWADIISVRGKLDMEVQSIDDVIMLLDYIDSLKKQDNTIGEISAKIDDLSKRMDYIESVYIKFPGHQFAEFLEIRNWPRTFRQYIEDRKKELLDKKDDLYEEMNKEIQDVFAKIDNFKETIRDVLKQGLIERALEYDQEDLASIGDSQGSQGDKPADATIEEEDELRVQRQAELEQAEGKTFAWLAKEIKFDHMTFDPDIIEKVYQEIERLKQEFDEVERSTTLINKRETLLGVQKTQFTELKTIQDDLKPLYELWLVASRYSKTVPTWIEGKFEVLDAGQIETKIDEWVGEMKRLQKTPLLLQNEKQKELQKFIFDSLNHFKRYGPMLRTLRTKGLATRHWKMIANKLEVIIDPTVLTLYRLIKLELHDEEKLKTIKQICEIATKEYTVQLSLETLDKEMRSVEFEMSLQPDRETHVVLKLPDIVLMFEEFFLRASVLKTNPHINNFKEKLLEIEKIIKNVIELVNEWSLFQRNFVYLNSIFCLDEITKSLTLEFKIFTSIQQLYQQTTTGFQAQPQVFRINFKENFSTVLVKANQDSDTIKAGLTEFLEKKRGKFPRLFFLSNEELIDIFGKGPDLIDSIIEDESRSFINNIFEGIDMVKFHPITQDITHMVSKEGEEVCLKKEVPTRQVQIDSWLTSLEKSMVFSVQDSVFHAFANQGQQEVQEWVEKWPGQATFLASQIWFTFKVEAILAGATERERLIKQKQSIEGGNDNSDEDEDDQTLAPSNFQQLQISPSSGQVPGDQDNIEYFVPKDPDAEEERIYQENLLRQIQKDEVFCPERAQLEKILRLKSRFRINSKKSAGEQMEKVLLQIGQTILQFTEMVRKRMKKNIRASTVALITCQVNLRDIMDGLLRSKVTRADEFKWLMQFKFNMKKMEEAVYKSAYDPSALNKLETNKIEVDCEVFGNSRAYGWEYLGNSPRLVVTPLTERCQRSLLVALQYNYGGAPEGPFGTGKTETTKDLSKQVAKLCFVLNCSANYEYNGICRFFKGLAASGAWTVFDEFNRMEKSILSLISQVIISIQGALKLQQTHVTLEEQKVVLKPDCAIFITLNPGYAGRSDLPINLKTLFRSVSMVVPDSTFITEILLYSAGFVGALQLAQKIVRIQNLANVVMQKGEIAHDFGLRSIKAIIGIAETLKLHAQDIKESELTEIIDDYTLEAVGYKSEQVIREVMNKVQAKIGQNSLIDANGATIKSGIGKGNINFTGRLDVGELVKIEEQNEVDDDFLQTVQPTERSKGNTSRRQQDDQNAAMNLESIRSSNASINQQALDSYPGRVLSHEIANDMTQLKGELYDRVWNRVKFQERQRRTVFRQIGIDPDEDYTEEELEEFIILKAVRDFNHSKFAVEEHIIIEGAIKDVFQGSVPDIDRPIQDYTNLKEALHQSFQTCKIDYAQNLKTKALQFYEILRSKHGCIIVGEPQSGKSTLIYLLQSALNKAALNEFKLAVSEKRRERLILLAQEKEGQIINDQISQNQQSGRSEKNEVIGGALKKKNKKGDKEAAQKKLFSQWSDLYRTTKLTQEDLDLIRQTMTVKGVALRRLNPKGMTMDEMFGVFDKESHEWHEGAFTVFYREFAASRDDKKKWVLLDGPIDYMWVENLNSILDENKRMSLPNGESIKMSEGMSILLETNHLKNVTPATVSRCGLIHLHRRETCNPKAIFNQWLRTLPPNLSEYTKDLEIATNYLMSEAIIIYEIEQKAGRIQWPSVDLHWLMQNFVRLFQTFIYDYFVDFEKTNTINMAAKNMAELGKSLMNLTLGNKWVDMLKDPNETFYTEDDDPGTELPKPTQEISQELSNEQLIKKPSSSQASRLGSRAQQNRIATPNQIDREIEKKKRLPRNCFIESEMRYENALKFTAIWLEAFMVTSLVWTFQPVLSDQGRRALDHRLKVKYASAKTDYSTYQREKKRKLAERNRERSVSNQKSMEKNKSIGNKSGLGNVFKQKQSISSEKSNSQSLNNQDGRNQMRSSMQNFDGYTAQWTDELEEKPMLISDYPENCSFYDFYFNLESSQWNKFSLELEIADSTLAYSQQLPSQKGIRNLYIPTNESIRYQYLLECFVTNQSSTLVAGPSGSGRSSLMRQMLFVEVFNFTKQLQTEHITMSNHTSCVLFKENIEKLLEWRKSKQTGTNKLRPHLENKLICYVEDMHLGAVDQHGDQTSTEAVRDYLTQQTWLSSRKRQWREIEDLTFFGCLSTNSPEQKNVSSRVLHLFNLIAIEMPSMKTINHIVGNLCDTLVLNWPSSIQIYAKDIASALIDISVRIFKHLRPTPMKAQYTFSWRDIHRILNSIEMAEENSLKKQEKVMKLFYHEVYRNFADRILMKHDLDWLRQNLQEVCRKYFFVVDELEDFTEHDMALKKNQQQTKVEKKQSLMSAASEISTAQKANDEIDPKRRDQFLWPIHDPESLFFSSWNQEVEGYYMEVEKINEIEKVVASVLERHNDSNERTRIDLMLFNHLCRIMLKILRAISMPNGHLINVAMKGFGVNQIMKLVTFAAGHILREIEVYDGYSLDEWHSDLRRAVAYCGNEGKPLTLYVDEYKLVEPQMYQDLACLIKNNVVSDIIRKNDIMLCLANIYQQIEAEKKAQKYGLDANELKNEKQELQEERERQEQEMKQDFISDNKKMMAKWPHIQAQCQKIFLNRVKKNFHVVIQFTPTGQNFRERISKHKDLLYNSSLVFITDFMHTELCELGKGFFKLEHEKAVEKAIVDGTGIVKVNQYSLTNEKGAQDKVLNCIVKMFISAQDMTRKYAEEEKHILTFTPTVYLSVFKCYKKLLKERKEIVKDVSQRYDQGLQKIRNCQDEIYRYHQELEKRSPKLLEQQRQLMKVIAEYEAEFQRIKAQRDQLKRDEFDAELQTEQALKIKEQCEEALDKLIPALNEAMNQVTMLTKHDIAELRSMQKPPKAVKLVLQVVCMLLNVPPAEKRSRKTGKLKLSYWKAAQGPEVLGDPGFSQVLVEFDRNKLTPEKMMEVEDVLQSSNYSYEKARSASFAATGIFKWVNATRDYFYVFKDIEPRRDAFMLSQKQYEEKKKQLEEKTTKISHLYTALGELKTHQKSKDDVIEELRQEIQDCSVRKKRADILLQSLSAEKQKWVVCTRMLSNKYSTVTGDVLISAGFISLLGGFNQNYRQKIIRKWQKILTEEGFPCSKEFSLSELFGDTFKIRKWHMNLLPEDILSINNALIIEKTKAFILLIDPQVQGITWLKKMHDSTLTTLKQDDLNFKKNIEIAIEAGRTVIIEGITSHVGINLHSLIKKQITKYGGQHLISFCRKQYKYDKNFRLFVVSQEQKPNLDVNVTNHVTLINFGVNEETLMTQMLGLIIFNERRDLGENLNENSKEAFDSIKSLKDIEAEILKLLDNDVIQILGEDSLIRVLNDSKNTAEFCASKLKNIAQTNQFIAKSREIYQPVALRATTLYFVVRDLNLINPLYQFSLAWFKKVFTSAMEMTNAFSDQHKTHDSEEDETMGDATGAGAILNNTFSIDDRIDLIQRTFTQELYKKLMIAVFDEDKQLITYTIVTRVLEKENMLDKSMYNFLIYGAQKLNPHSQIPKEILNLPLLTNVMWAELQYLSYLRPFNAQNLLSHIIENQAEWSKIFDRELENFSFQDLPNFNNLDLKFFSLDLDDELETRPLSVVPKNQIEVQSQQIMGTDVASMAARTVGDTNSRAGSRGTMKRSESGILNDPEIWEISDSDDDDQVGKGNQQRLKTADNAANLLDQKLKIEDNQDTKDEDDEKADQEDLARYLVERAPSINGRPGSQSNLSDGLRKKTTKERQLILKRERVMKGLCEMAILRCLRPDMLIENMNRFVLNVLDPNYFDFKEDIMAQLLAAKNKPKGIGQKNIFLATNLASGAKVNNTQSKISIVSKSNTLQTQQSNQKIEKQQSQFIQTQNNNQSSARLENQVSQSGENIKESQNTYQNSQGSAAQLNKKNARQDETTTAAQERLAQRIRRGGYNNIQHVIREAFTDSNNRSPILFLMAHSINLLEILTEFTNRIEPGKANSKLHYYPLGQGLEEMVEEKLTKAALNGDWILLENLHLVEEWLPVLEDKLAKWKENEINTRFRLWIGCTPSTNFPQQFTERAIKVALQPPETIQKKIIKMLSDQEKENAIKKAGKQVGLHKNLFFSLTYMHSILHGRKKYGTLGFNIPYKFDFSDFEVSNSQLISCLKSNNNDQTVMLDMLKYFYAQINYSGKVQRVEDQIILNAICDDLFDEKIIFSTEGLESNPNQSHYGFPKEHEDLNSFVDEFFPIQDNYQIYGFSFLTDAEQKKEKIFYTLEQIGDKFQIGNELVSRSQNIEMNSLEITIRSSTGEQGPQIFKMLNEQTSLLNLFTAMQKALELSSLDRRVTNSVKRYDKNVAQESLPKRDENDQQVAKVARTLIKQIDSLFDIEIIQKNFPIMYMAPINNIINRELSAYRSLLRTIRGSVEDLLANIDGKYPREFEIEALWNKIQQNQVPEKWKMYSFATSKDSLADFIVELSLKLEFWDQLLKTEDIEKFPSFWLRAFFDPKSFLASFMQKKSRSEQIPLKQVYNKYIVTDVYKNDAPISEKHIHFVHGLNIEGAEWDANEQILVETTLRKRFNLFPAIQIQTIKQDGELRGATPIERFANFSLNMDTKKSRKLRSTSPTKKEDSKNLSKQSKKGFSFSGLGRTSPTNENEQKKEYRCPIFQTTNRLSKGIISSDQAPIEYVKLLTIEEPRKWVKRAVAIVLEAD